MIRLAARRPFRLALFFALTFCLVYGPVYSLNPARAEPSPSGAPAKKAVTPQPITKAHKRGEVIIKFKDNIPQQVREMYIARVTQPSPHPTSSTSKSSGGDHSSVTKYFCTVYLS